MYARDHAVIATPIGFVRIEGDAALTRITIEREGTARRGSIARAIGQACRNNPLPIVVPCHRIVGGSGHYSAGEGITTKNWLLDHERRFARMT